METTDIILSKSLELFKRYGIRSVTMDEIAGQCGISKKTIYQEYADKDNLVKSAMATIIYHLQHGCQTFAQKSQNAIEEMFLAMDMVQGIFEDVNPAMLYDVRKYHYNAYLQLEQHKKEFMHGMIEDNLQRGIREGLYRSDIIVDIIAELHHSLISLLFEQDHFPTKAYSLTTIQKEIITHYLYGIATPKGARLIEQYKQQRTKIK